jgi:hypothetical protein
MGAVNAGGTGEATFEDGLVVRRGNEGPVQKGNGSMGRCFGAPVCRAAVMAKHEPDRSARAGPESSQ